MPGGPLISTARLVMSRCLPAFFVSAGACPCRCTASLCTSHLVSMLCQSGPLQLPLLTQDFGVSWLSCALVLRECLPSTGLQQHGKWLAYHWCSHWHKAVMTPLLPKIQGALALVVGPLVGSVPHG